MLSYILVTVVCLALLYGVFLVEYLKRKRKEAQWLLRVKEQPLSLNEKKYTVERMDRILRTFEKHGKEEGLVDDITWDDLDMDEIFRNMNYTQCSTGEEYLYYALHKLKTAEELEEFEKLVAWFDSHTDDRAGIQLLCAKMGSTGKYSLQDYIDNLDQLGKRSNAKHILQALLFVPLIVLCFFEPQYAVVPLVALAIFNIITYFNEKGDIDPYITSFAYVMRLLDSCNEFEKMELPPAQDCISRIRENNTVMKKMRRGSFWVMSPTRGNSGTSDLLGMLLDYIRMLFHLDLIIFNKMLSFLQQHIEEIDNLILEIGYLESSVCAWIYRKSLTEGWCVPEFCEERTVKMTEGYHPLLTNPVKNSIDTKHGVLLTGSNASGKSTFLKTVALNAILARTIHTCAAKEMKLRPMEVFSSMALRDSIENGESYYIVEIKALKRILDAAATGKNILCFVDEVLRGTNTVERIAASAQIMKSLDRDNVICFAATHDIELTGLLEEQFDNYHFEEEIQGGDIVFPFKLYAGKATSRNAIRLLKMIGYEDSIIDNAMRQAEHFVEFGTWETNQNS